MKFSFIGFSEDLRKSYLYIYNDGCEEVALKGLLFDGEDVTSKVYFKQEVLRPKQKTVGVLSHDKPLEIGSFHTFTLNTSIGEVQVKKRTLKPFFPVLLYDGHKVLDDLARIEECYYLGFNAFTGNVDLLDKAEKYGFKLICSPGAPPNPDIVNRGKNHPALLAWYIMDEPDIWEFENLQRGTTREWSRIVNNLDPKNPTYITLCKPEMFEMFSDATDYVAVDDYVIAHLPLEHVSHAVDRLREAVAPKPAWVTLQAFRFCYPTPGGWWVHPRYPTPEEERLMVYMALGHGAKGILYYTAYTTEPHLLKSKLGAMPQKMDGLLTAPIDLKDAIARLNVELNILGPLLVNSDTLTIRGDFIDWCSSNSGSVEACSLLCGTDTIVMIAINHNYVSTERGITVTPVKRVKLKLSIPRNFDFEPRDCFTVSYNGLEKIEPDIWLEGWGQIWKREKIIITLDEISLTKCIVITENKDLYRALQQRWHLYRRDLID